MSVQSLTLAVPAYNEETSLEESISALLKSAEACGIPFGIIVVDDGSTDRTGAVLDALAQKNPKVTAIHHAENRMIGGAFLSALTQARTSHIIIVPVDNPLPADQLKRFIEAAKDADIVVGAREERTGYRAWMKALSKIYKLSSSALFGLDLKDLTWISLYDREKISGLSLRFEGIAIFIEILSKAKRRGLRLAEIPCPMIARRTGRATVSRLSRIFHLGIETLRLWFHIHFGKW